MIIGMLWQDLSDKPLQDKITAAAVHYRYKYQGEPNLCFVNPGELGDLFQVGSIVIKPHDYVRPNNLWIGIEEVEQ